jgi:aminoglycoside phosphotransferase (APT) family kinase protein
MTQNNLGNGFLMQTLPSIVKAQTGKEAENLRFIGGGSYGKVFCAGIDGKATALKAYLVPGSQNDEAEQLRILRKNTSVPMPEVLFTFEDEQVSLLAMSFIEGKNALSPAFLLKSRHKKLNFARQVVEGMSQWHSVTNRKFGPLQSPGYSSWHDYFTSTKRDPWLSGLSALNRKGRFSDSSLELLLKATEIFDKIHTEPETAVLTHGDLNIMNIMADPRTFELTGFIDPNGSCFADMEYDLFQLRNMWGDAFGLYETYKSEHNLSEYADFKVAYYAAMNEASMRLKGGIPVPVWEIADLNRLKKEMKKLV